MLSQAKFFLLSDNDAIPKKLNLSGVVDNVVFLKHATQNSTDNVASYDENVVKTCGYFWNLDAQQIEEKIQEKGYYCGHVDCWKYANSKGGITPKALKHQNSYLIRKFANLGNLDVLIYLCENEFGGDKLTIADIRSGDNEALRWAACNGHLEVLKYLCENEFGGMKLTIADIRSDNNEALRWAAQFGHLEALKYLCESDFGGEKLTIADIRSKDNYALQRAAKNGHLEVLKYLFESDFGGEKLTIADIRSQNNFALRWATHHNHSEIVKYISDKYL